MEIKQYGFTDEVIREIIKYCKSKGKTDENYISAVAENWYKHNIITMKDLRIYYQKYKGLAELENKISNLIKRELTEYEKYYLEQWICVHKFSKIYILKTIKETKGKINFDEIDKKINENRF